MKLPALFVYVHHHRGQNPVLLALASIPATARYRKLHTHSPTLRSRSVPATKDAHLMLQGPAASCPTLCKSFLVSWPKCP